MLNNLHIDQVLLLYFGILPSGENYFTLTYKCNFNAQEWEAIFDYLIDENFIEHWGNEDKQVITKKGIEVITKYGGIEDYLITVNQNKKKK